MDSHNHYLVGQRIPIGGSDYSFCHPKCFWSYTSDVMMAEVSINGPRYLNPFCVFYKSSGLNSGISLLGKMIYKYKNSTKPMQRRSMAIKEHDVFTARSELNRFRGILHRLTHATVIGK